MLPTCSSCNMRPGYEGYDLCAECIFSRLSGSDSQTVPNLRRSERHLHIETTHDSTYVHQRMPSNSNAYATPTTGSASPFVQTPDTPSSFDEQFQQNLERNMCAEPHDQYQHQYSQLSYARPNYMFDPGAVDQFSTTQSCIDPALLMAASPPAVTPAHQQRSVRSQPPRKSLTYPLPSPRAHKRAPNRNKGMSIDWSQTRFQCRIGLCAHILFVGDRRQGITIVKDHINEYHPMLSGSSPSNGQQVACPWTENDGSSCTTKMSQEGLAKHIATVHLQLTIQRCEYCQAVTSRRDAAKRHLLRDCPVIKGHTSPNGTAQGV